MEQVVVYPARIRTTGEILRALQESKRRLDRFFEIELDMPLVVILSSRRQFDAFWGKKMDDWMIAWARNRVIYALEKKVVARERKKYSSADYQRLLTHEYAHIYINSVGFSEAMPRWLKEGLACWLAGQHKHRPEPELLQTVFQDKSIDPKNIYSIGYTWIDLLVRRFGKKSLISLLRGLKNPYSQASFKRVFFRVYHKQWSRALLLNSRKHEICNKTQSH